MAELKPCPFCGGKAIIEHTHLCNRKRTQVICQKCGATHGYCGTESAAIKKWNRRADNG